MLNGGALTFTLFITFFMSAPAWAEELPKCKARYLFGPLFVTPDCLDPPFQQPQIDVDELRTEPVQHRYINGHFEGTQTRFSFYFPTAESAEFEGRFFHYVLPSPSSAPGTEDTAAINIDFAADSGAYFVQTNGGGAAVELDEETGEINPLQALASAFNQTIAGYRADAAAARFSRQLATEIYGAREHIYGYRFGGSGGSYKTIAGAENTRDIWDGHLPFVMPTPLTIPNTYSVRAHALRVIRRGNKCAALKDAIEPGAVTGIYEGLNEEEQAALREATQFGFPLRGWYTCEVMNLGALPLVFPAVSALDPGYFNRFWNQDGYLGSDPNSSINEDIVQTEATVGAIVDAEINEVLFPYALQLGGTITQGIPQGIPQGDLTIFSLEFLEGRNQGKSVTMIGLNRNTMVATFEPYTSNPKIVENLQLDLDEGLVPHIRIDNKPYLALQTYHRHQVPTQWKYWWDWQPGFYVFDQFRQPGGKPLYPQRPFLVGPLVTGTGTVQLGHINGKMMVMQTMMDIDALPWMADWYRSKVQRYLRGEFNDRYRLYFIDNADHGSEVGAALEGQIVDPGRSPTHIVRYRPVLEQLLLDLSAWVEQDKAPIENTHYSVVDGQVELPDNASMRMGVQPVIQLAANGGERAQIAAGDSVRFSAQIDTPPGAGKVVKAEWDFEGAGDFPEVEELTPAESVHLTASHTYSQPGTYFPVLRVTSQRHGNPDAKWGQIENLIRVRVVVEAFP